MAKRIPKINYNLYNPTTESATVMLTMTINGGRVRFAPGISVNPKYWDKKAKRVSGKMNLEGKGAAEINELLESWSNIALKFYLDNPDITATDLIEELKEQRDGRDGIPKAVKTTLDGFATYYAQRQKEYSSNPRNFDNLVSAARYLVLFSEYKKTSLYWRNINKDFARSFRAFLERDEFNLSKNQVSNIFHRLVHIMKAASDEDGGESFHSNTAYKVSEFKIATETPYRHHLNEDELAQLMNCDLSDEPDIEDARNLFIINAYTGLRRKDAKRVSRDNYHVSEEGNEQIKIYTSKSSKVVHVPLMPEAKRLLEHYNWLLPKFSDPTYNKRIKIAAQRAGLDTPMSHTETRAGKRRVLNFEKWEKISSHDARRSFATNFYELGFPAALLMQITGHAREDTFYKYICTTPERAANLFADRLETVRAYQKEQATKKLLEDRATNPATVTNN
jgi:integrase